MSNMRTLSYLHDGDYISYKNRIYKIEWGLPDNNNVICVKNNKPCFIDEYERVKWLRNYEDFTIIK